VFFTNAVPWRSWGRGQEGAIEKGGEWEEEEEMKGVV
jgi:hypothetical protein